MAATTTLQKITTRAKQIRQAHPKKAWTDCIKAASKEIKAGKKVAGYVGTRRDGNKTHVLYSNIKPAKKIGALPIGFQGNFYGYKFKIVNQYQIDGRVEAQIIHDGSMVAYLDGTKAREDATIKTLKAGAIVAGEMPDNKDLSTRVTNFVKNLNKEVVLFNKGKDVRLVNKKPLVYKTETKKLATIDKVKQILFADKKRLAHGYKLVTRKKIAGVGIGVNDFRKKHELIQKHVGELMGKIAYHKHIATTDKTKKTLHNSKIKELQSKVKEHKATIAKLKKVI